ncbi:hypothetical protein [Actinoplanes sp. NPDC049681]|uniref:hypothetical protein n=1 Tax=Actinoplanes sp. NPDC049681 TaxID=3363905 RepID=UPI0037AA33BB
MNRKQACQQVVEGATDWIYLIARVSDDPSLQSVNSMELDQLSFKISETLPYLDRTTAEHAGKLVNPLTTLQSVMATGENLDVDLEEARDAVPDVLAGCRGKASLKGYDSPYNK